jgi:branched-chain amino acid transport system substrate-binding protein
MKLWKLGALAATAAILVAACSSSGSSPAASSGAASAAPAESAAAGGGAKGTVKIGISLPLSGSDLAAAGPARDGALLAIKNAGVIDGWTIETSVLDHAVNGVHDPQQGAKDMQTLASDTAVVGVVGPFNSSVAKAQIPVSNEAGLLQCSPANTNPDLTKGDAGKQLRQANPDKINYIRVAATDDIQGPAVAQFGIQNLGLKKVFIIDDTETYGKGLADAFAAEWTKEGGTVVGREGAPKGTTDYVPILTKAASLSPDSVFFGGVTSTGGGLVRKQMAQAGLGALPYMGGDGIQDGPGTTDGSMINIAGTTAANSYSSVAAIHDIPNKDKFVADYKAAYGVEPGAYAASGYACAQVILDAIKRAAAAGDVTREAVRAAAVDPAAKYDTVLGPLSFDAVGDTSQHVISLYKVDMTQAGGKGDWVFEKQIDFK